MPPAAPPRPSSRARSTGFALAATLVLLAAGPAAASGWQVDPGRTIAAVLTHKAGVGARLAHDHLVVAPASTIDFAFDAERPEATRFTLAVRAEELAVDPPELRAALPARLAELGALPAGKLPAIDAADRKKIRAAMLGESQLDAAKHPEIRAELLAVGPRGKGGAESARVALGWTAKLRLTVHGKPVELEAPLRWEVAGGELVAEALAEARFTDFGIEPYSTMLGAIKNDDLFHLYLKLVAKSTP